MRAVLPSGLPSGLPCGLVDELVRWFDLCPTAPGRSARNSEQAVVELVTAPLRLEPTWPPPIQPRPVNDGWIHDETVEDDQPVLEHLLAVAGPSRSAEDLAAEAQAMRLPVVSYRSIGEATRYSPLPDPVGPVVEPNGRLIVDLSTHWAGPLAGSILADLGATVVKVDPEVRPDGFRSRRRLYDELNGNKDIVDLDLRGEPGRAGFEALLRRADLVIESFSRRVLPNLGFGPAGLSAAGCRASVLTIRAFPAGSPEWAWLAYGPGVHAASGLGLVDGRPVPCPVAYPDAVAGLAAAAHALRLLDRRQRRREISLAGAVAPLVDVARHRDRSSTE